MSSTLSRFAGLILLLAGALSAPSVYAQEGMLVDIGDGGPYSINEGGTGIEVTTVQLQETTEDSPTTPVSVLNVTYSLDTQPLNRDIFSINSATGMISASGSDYEMTTMHMLTVRANSVAPSTTYNVTLSLTVNIINLNDTAPVIGPITITVASLATDAIAGPEVVGRFRVSDADDTPGQNSMLDIRLSGDTDSFGVAPPNGDTGTEFVIRLTQILDHAPGELTVTVTADDGANTDDATFTVTVTNLPPTASIATDPATSNLITGQEIELNATGSTDGHTGGQITDYEWRVLSGEDIANVLSSTDMATTNFTAPLGLTVQTAYEIELTVTDNNGESSSATTTLTVYPVDLVNAGDSNNTALTVSVNENLSPGTGTGLTVEAQRSDGVTLSVASWTIPGGVPFAISPGGVVTVVSALDFETNESFVFNVTATLAMGMDLALPGGASSRSESIQVNIINLNDTAPVIGPITITVASLATDAMAGPEVVGRFRVSDADDTPGQNSMLDIRLSGDTDSFGVTPPNGDTGTEFVIRLTQILDHEPGELTVTVTADDGANTDDATFTVTVTNLPPTASIATAPTTSNLITGQEIELDATGSTDGHTGGQITDYEWRVLSGEDIANVLSSTDMATTNFTAPLGLTVQTAYEIELRVTDNNEATNSVRTTLTVYPVDLVNAGDSDNTALTVSVDENAGMGADTGLTVAARRSDGETLTVASWTIPGGVPFAISPGGVVTVVSALDFETNESFVFNVTATLAMGMDLALPGGASSRSESIRVNIINLNDTAPVIGPITITVASLATDAMAGPEVVGRFRVSDADDTPGQNSMLDIRLSGDTDSFGVTPPNGDTGTEFVIRLTQILDHEPGELTVTVTADDGANTDDATFTVTVTNLPPTASIATAPTTSNLITGQEIELNATGSTDGHTGGQITDYEWRVLSGEDIANVLSSTDMATTNFTAPLGLTVQTAYEIELRVTDNNEATNSVRTTLTVYPVDLVNAGDSDNTALTVSVDENAGMGADTGLTVAARRSDGETLTVASWTIPGGVPFAISPGGVVTVVSALDFETNESFVFNVTATLAMGMDLALPGGASSRSESIRVNIINLNDTAPVIGPITITVASLATDAMAGPEVVGRFRVSDADDTPGQNSMLDIRLSGDTDSFGVTPPNGDTGTEFVIRLTQILDHAPGELTVTVTADDGANTDDATFTVTVTNLPPTASIATAPTTSNLITGQEIELNATGSTDGHTGGQITDYEWRVLSGEDIANVLSSTDMATTNFTAPLGLTVQTAYEIELRVTDNNEATNSVRTTLTVYPVDLVNAGDSDNTALTVSVDENAGMGADTGLTVAARRSDGETLTVASWTIPGGVPFAISPGGVVTVVSALDFETNESFVFNVTATLAMGMDLALPGGASSRSESIQVNIINLNDTAPVIGPITITVASLATDAMAGPEVGRFMVSDADNTVGDPAAFSITLSGGDERFFRVTPSNGNTGTDFVISLEEVLNHEPGELTVTVTANDGVRDSEEATFNVTVTNLPPTALIATAPTTSNLITGQEIELNATGSTDGHTGGQITDYEWRVLSGEDIANVLSSTDMATTNFTAPLGLTVQTAYEIELRVTDNNEATNSVRTTLTVYPVDLVNAGDSDNTALTVSVDENAGMGADTGLTVAARRSDGETLTVASWTIPGGVPFAISPGGVVTVMSALDRETNESFVFNVTAMLETGADLTLPGNAGSRLEEIRVNINDLDELLTITDTEAGDNTIAENTAMGTEVSNLMLLADDPDLVNGNVTSLTIDMVTAMGDPTTITGVFDVTPTVVDGNITARLTVATDNVLDHEAVEHYVVTIRAESSPEAVTAPFTVTVTDVNEAPTVEITSDDVVVERDGAFLATLDEPIQLTAIVTDVDDGDTHTYSWISSSETNVEFGQSDNSTTTFIASMVADYSVSLTVTDTGSLPGTAMAVVRAVDPTGICGRTQQVQNRILDSIDGRTDCASVTEAELAGVSILQLDVKEGRAGRVGLSGAGLRPGDFQALFGLLQLGLSRNELTTLPDDIFSDLTSLKHLGLRGNGFMSLQDDIFSGLDNLRYLGLWENQLATLPDFSNLVILTELQLGANRLTNLSMSNFAGLANLEALWLNDNDLSSLSTATGVFTGLGRLQDLLLHNNELTNLSDGVFAGLDDLQRLNLSGNSDLVLGVGVFDDILDTLTSLNLDAALKGTVSFPEPAVSFAMGTTVTVSVQLDKALPARMRVPYSVEFDGGGVESDFDGLSATGGMLEFNAGETENRTIEVTAPGTATLGAVANLTLGDPVLLDSGGNENTHFNVVNALVEVDRVLDRHTLIVNDADASLEVTGFTAVDASNVNDGTAIDLLLILNRPTTEAITIPYNITGTEVVAGDIDDADADGDGNSLTGRIIVNPESNAGRSRITTTEDFRPEGMKTFTVSLGSLPAGLSLAVGEDGMATYTVSDICSRTGQVVNAIVAAAGVTDCGDVTPVHLAGITLLDLSSTDIQTLQVGDFAGLTGLQTLNLEENQLMELPAMVFDGLGNLRKLQLNNNRLTGVSGDVFTGLDSLEELRLQDNGTLANVSASVFSGLTRLELLDLSDSILMENVLDSVFDGLGNLETLLLSGNDPMIFMPDNFLSLTGLQELWWLENTEFSAGLFDNVLDTLEQLIISADVRGALSFDRPDTALSQGASVEVEITLSRDLPAAVQLPYTLSFGGDVDESDFPSPGGTSGTVTFAAGETMVTVTVTAEEDVSVTGTTVRLTLGDPVLLDGAGEESPLDASALVVEGAVQTHTITVIPQAMVADGNAANDEDGGVFGAVEENASADTPVGIMAVARRGANNVAMDDVTFMLSSDDFQIDTNTGVVTTKRPLDYEMATSHTITVTAMLLNVMDNRTTAQATFTIVVTNVNDNDPEIIGLADVSVQTGAPTGTVVASFMVRDDDGMINGGIPEFSINVGETDLQGESSFAVTPSRGDAQVTFDISLAEMLAGTARPVEVLVSVEDDFDLGSGEELSSEATFTVNVVDEPLSASIVTDPTGRNLVTGQVITLDASDSIDQDIIGIEYAWNVFEGASRTNVTTERLDDPNAVMTDFTAPRRSELMSEETTQTEYAIDLMLMPGSGAPTAEITLTVHMVDLVNIAGELDTELTVSVSENAVSGTETELTVAVQSSNGDRLDVASWSLPADVPFAINSDGIVTVAGDLDFETSTLHSFLVTAALAEDELTFVEGEELRSEGAVVTIGNEDEPLTIIDTDTVINTIPENAVTDTVVANLALLADDQDDGDDVTTMTIGSVIAEGTVTPTEGLFAVIPTSRTATNGDIVFMGQLMLLAVDELDYETVELYNVEIMARSSSGGVVDTLVTETFAVNVINVNDTAPEINGLSEVPVQVQTGSAMGTELDRFRVSDDDGVVDGQPSMFTIVPSGADASLFAVTPTTGTIQTEFIISLATELARQAMTTLTMVIKANDNVNISEGTTFTVSVVDEPLNATITDPTTRNLVTGQVITLDASESIDQSIIGIEYTWKVFEGRTSTNNLADSLLSDAAAIETQFNAPRPELMPAEQTEYVIELTLMPGSGMITTETTLTVYTVDLVNTAAAGETDLAGSVEENAVAGTGTGLTVSAQRSDDLTLTGTSWSFPTDVPFAIDSDGVVTVAGALDFEASTSHSFLVTATLVAENGLTFAEGAESRSEEVEVTIVNVNEPLTIIDTDGGDNTIAEDADTDTVVANLALLADDPDSEDDVTSLTIGEVTAEGDAEAITGLFGISTSSVTGGNITATLSLLAVDRLDRETVESYEVTIEAESMSEMITETFLVMVTDVNDSAPVITFIPEDGENPGDGASGTLLNDVSSGANVVRFTVADADPDDVDSTDFRTNIVGMPASNLFAIVEDMGAVLPETADAAYQLVVNTENGLSDYLDEPIAIVIQVRDAADNVGEATYLATIERRGIRVRIRVFLEGPLR